MGFFTGFSHDSFVMGSVSISVWVRFRLAGFIGIIGGILYGILARFFRFGFGFGFNFGFGSVRLSSGGYWWDSLGDSLKILYRILTRFKEDFLSKLAIIPPVRF